MKQFTFTLMFTLCTLLCFAQDDDILSPFDGEASASNPTSTPPPVAANIITETYQIPSYNLYLQDWNTEYLKIKSLGISFGNNDDIKIILVESHNHAFSMPCDMYQVTSQYGMRKGSNHTGIDLALKLGAPIRCCFDGVVRMAKEYSTYGKTVVVRHYNGLETVYAHLDSICVVPNEIVNAGQLIGTAGNTGRSSGVHLHFETRFLYEHFDPEKMVDFGSGDLISNVLTIAKSELDFDTPAEEAVQAQTPTQPQSQTHPTPTPTTTSTNTSSTTSNNNTPKNNNTSTTGNNNSNNAVIHTVVQGDTLYGIARKYGTTLDKLLKLNNLTEESKLQLGQKIRVR